MSVVCPLPNDVFRQKHKDIRLWRYYCISAQLQRSSRKVPPITRWLSGGRHLLLTGRTLLKCHFM